MSEEKIKIGYHEPEKKTLLPSQVELLHMKRQNLIMAQNSFNGTVAQIAKELGIPDDEKWRLSNDFKTLTKFIPPSGNKDKEVKK